MNNILVYCNRLKNAEIIGKIGHKSTDKNPQKCLSYLKSLIEDLTRAI